MRDVIGRMRWGMMGGGYAGYAGYVGLRITCRGMRDMRDGPHVEVCGICGTDHM